mmetsp:Transcript_33917/g.78222  ORF Transcript_33917/g.78222 Transcript_33917/m.78222 type:complete len:115 (-) Transcript_33917:99-443(-)
MHGCAPRHTPAAKDMLIHPFVDRSSLVKEEDHRLLQWGPRRIGKWLGCQDKKHTSTRIFAAHNTPVKRSSKPLRPDRGQQHYPPKQPTRVIRARDKRWDAEKGRSRATWATLFA